MNELVRYSKIDIKMPREFLLLQGRGCVWKKCTFCDYHTDISDSPYQVNRPAIEQVTGEYGVLDIINSGSALELDEKTLQLIAKTVKQKNIHTLWFEAHYLYRNKLADFAKIFYPATVKFRCGIESFNGRQRNLWHKGIDESVTAEDVAKYFKGVCLLVCVKGQTRQTIQEDIQTAKKYFEYFSINLFCNNTTKEKRDNELAEWFYKEMYPVIKDDPQIEILNINTDLGVG